MKKFLLLILLIYLYFKIKDKISIGKDEEGYTITFRCKKSFNKFWK